MHTGTENISMARVEEKTEAFEFIRNLLTLLLQHGLDPNVRFSQRSHHILLSLMDMVQVGQLLGKSPDIYLLD